MKIIKLFLYSFITLSILYITNCDYSLTLDEAIRKAIISKALDPPANNSFGTALLINADGSSHSDSFTQDDNQSYYKFNAVAGKSYSIKTNSSNINFNSYLILYNSSQSQITYDDDNGNHYLSRIEFNCVSSGVYYIMVYGFTTGDYSMSVKEYVQASTPTLPLAKKDWTIMVYMDGNNNLSPFTVRNVYQMMDACVSTNNVNIVVYWAQNSSYSGYLVTPGYYYITNNSYVLLENTSDALSNEQNAKDFISYTLTNLSANHYMFIYWNHGSTVDRSVYNYNFSANATNIDYGVCYDSGEHLSEVEQRNIMAYFKSYNSNTNLDIVAYDACFIGGYAEVMYQNNGLVNYYVGSENSIPADGYNYNFLSEVISSPSISASNLAKAVVNYYSSYYSGYSRSGASTTTLAAINLSYMHDLSSDLNDFANDANATGLGSAFSGLKSSTQAFLDSSYNYYSSDLYDYLNNVYNSTEITDSNVKASANALMSLIKGPNLILANYYGSAYSTNKANGISVCLLSATPTYRLLELCHDTSWDENFLNWAGF